MLSEWENFVPSMCENGGVRSMVTVLAGMLTASMLTAAPPAAAEPVAPAPPECNYPDCTPGIAPNIVLGSYCNNFSYYAFGVTNWGRLVFCGSPRRYDSRWFRSPEMHGVKNEGDTCAGQDGDVAQAPDGLFLTCIAQNGFTLWQRGDL
jgi:hypothetical protein